MSVLYDSEGREQSLRCADLCVTGTAAVNTGLTITLPAVAGRFHYITHIEINKFYSVIGVAGAPVVVTTTNLQGSPAFTFDQSAAGAGTMSSKQIAPVTPIRSAVMNTATTIVAPVQLQTIWRITVWYYVAI